MQAKTFLIILFLALSNVGMAQVRISETDLVGTKWKIKDDDSPNEYYEFTSDDFIWHDDEGISHIYPYYLTDQPVYSYESSAFDSSKEGECTSGCYFVKHNNTSAYTFCYAIQYFNKDKGIMELKMVTKDIIGRGGPITFILIK